MDNEEIRIERWSICERYKNYKANNYYKEPVQFRPHPENVVRDVFMYHIYHNEGKLCNDDLIQYIKNKIIDDLNEIFMLYEYASDAISTIDRLMSSTHHLGTGDVPNEMLFHALTIEDARNILIKQISNVLIKYIPEPLGNVNFDVIMKGNPQNIEVGDVVNCELLTESFQSTVLAVNNWGYKPTMEDTIDYYKVSVTVLCKGKLFDVPVKDLTIIRKWNGFIPSEQVKQSEVKSQPTYLFEALTDKSIETMELAVKWIEGLTSADIVEVYRDNQSVVVTQNFVNKLCEFVNTKSQLFYPPYNWDVKFDGIGFWYNNERLDPQWFLDYIVERIITEELKRRVLSNKSN